MQVMLSNGEMCDLHIMHEWPRSSVIVSIRVSKYDPSETDRPKPNPGLLAGLEWVN